MFAQVVSLYPAGLQCKNKQGRLPIDMVVDPNRRLTKEYLTDMCSQLLALGKEYPDSLLRRADVDPVLDLLHCKLPNYIHDQVGELLRFRESIHVQKSASKAQGDVQLVTQRLTKSESAKRKAQGKVRELKKSLETYKRLYQENVDKLQISRDENGVLKRKCDAIDQQGLEASKVEQTLLSNLISSKGASCSLADLKTIAKSLQARFPHSNKPPSMWQILLPSLLKDDDAQKDTLVQVIEALKNELGTTEPGATTATPGEDNAGRNNKRPRVSLSPSLPLSPL